MDEIERAQQETERFLATSLRKHQQKQASKPEITAKGHCLNCDEPLAQLPDKCKAPRWCDADCRDDWDQRELAH